MESGDDSSGTPPGYEAEFKQDGTNVNIDLASVPVEVKNVHFDGIGRTKEDYLRNATINVFKAKNFGDLIIKVGEAQKDLKKLNVFSEVGTLVDTSKAPDASPDTYEITFLVKELKPLNGSVNTMVGSNEGSLQTRVSMPNILGRGEKVSLDHVISSNRERRSELTLSKPFPYMDGRIGTSIFLTKTPNPWSAINTSSLGAQVEYNCKLRKQQNLTVQWEGVWRTLNALHITSFPVRQYLGHSIKSSIRMSHVVDKRDQQIFPVGGWLRKISGEVAGLFGDAKFMKLETDWQYNKSVLNNKMLLQGCFRNGFLVPFSQAPTVYSINDLFFLGGPQNLRGFAMRGVGPRYGHDALGGKVYWASAVHLFTPLPWVNNKFWIAENVRIHGFVNVGSIGESAVDCLDVKNVRGACGIGLAYRFLGNMARLELNYCYPFKFGKGDRCKKGFQFGLGLEFL